MTIFLFIFRVSRECSAYAQAGNAFLLDHDLEGLQIASLLNLLLFLRLSSVRILLKPPLLIVFTVARRACHLAWLLFGFLRLCRSSNRRCGLIRDLEVTALSEALEHAELMKLWDGLLSQRLLISHSDLLQLLLIYVLELINEEHLRIDLLFRLWCFTLERHALIVLFRGLLYHLLAA